MEDIQYPYWDSASEDDDQDLSLKGVLSMLSLQRDILYININIIYKYNTQKLKDAMLAIQYYRGDSWSSKPSKMEHSEQCHFLRDIYHSRFWHRRIYFAECLRNWPLRHHGMLNKVSSTTFKKINGKLVSDGKTWGFSVQWTKVLSFNGCCVIL